MPTITEARTITELQIYEKANEIKREGWKSNVKYRMKRNTLVCSPSGKCRTLRPIGSAYRRRGGEYADYYGSAIMTKFLMEYILGKRIPFTSGDRPSSIGSARHHGGGGSRAFDLRVSTNLDEKAKVAAAWKFAAQTLGYQASVGMRYGNSSSMVHVDTVGSFGSRQWGSAAVSSKGRLVLKYYGKSRNTRMPCTVLARVLGGNKIRCNGGQVVADVPNQPIDQPYRSAEAVEYAGRYGVNINRSPYVGEYYKPVVYSSQTPASPTYNAPVYIGIPAQNSAPESITQEGASVADAGTGISADIYTDEEYQKPYSLRDYIYYLLYKEPKKELPFNANTGLDSDQSVPQKDDITYTIIDTAELQPPEPPSKSWIPL